ncbi:MAG TPA: hypothetical protein VNC59_07065 [Thermoanaerobaculia bacterium]|nr:hypothetical protein [Thermoanaerobaculia bacterium]
MEIAVEKRERATVVSIAGSVDGMSASHVVGAFREQIGAGNASAARMGDQAAVSVHAAGVDRSDAITMLAARRALK